MPRRSRRRLNLIASGRIFGYNDLDAHQAVAFEVELNPVVELGPRARVAFTAAWLAAQVALIVTAEGRPDHAFGFRMFSESSTVKMHLLRRLDSPAGKGAALIPVQYGRWIARDREGRQHLIRWSDRVHSYRLEIFDYTIHAEYGAAAQLARLQMALNDVASHIPDDFETRGLVAEVEVRKNGRVPYFVHLESALR